MRNPLLPLIAASLLSGCMATGTGEVHATVTTPNLVYIDSDVRVIEDYGEPIFYADNFYWRQQSGIWFRSPRHTTGWVRVQTAPPAIRRIERPSAYIHYRAKAKVAPRRDDRPYTPRDSKDHRD